MMTSTEFVARIYNVEQFYDTLYVMGCFGAPMNAANIARYTTNHPYNRKPERTAMIKAASPTTFGFDCVCLIKGILWGWNGDKTKTYGGARYISNGVPDVDANGMITLCKNVTTDFTKIVPGAAVWMQDHIGVYIGKGLVIECTPKWDNCVQQSFLANLDFHGTKERTWSKWGLLPWVDYETEEEEKMTEEKVREIAKATIVDYLKELSNQKPEPGSWQETWWNKAIEAGITADGSAPMGLATRVEVATMIMKNKEE